MIYYFIGPELQPNATIQKCKCLILDLGRNALKPGISSKSF